VARTINQDLDREPYHEEFELNESKDIAKERGTLYAWNIPSLRTWRKMIW